MSVITQTLSHGYHLLSHRICQVDIAYCHMITIYHHIVIVHHCIDIVMCVSMHSMTLIKAMVVVGYSKSAII